MSLLYCMRMKNLSICMVLAKFRAYFSLLNYFPIRYSTTVHPIPLYQVGLPVTSWTCVLQKGADLCVNLGYTSRECRVSLSDEERETRKEIIHRLVQDIDNHFQMCLHAYR